MNVMTVEGAKLILANGLEYEEVTHLESTKAYHYFSALVLGEHPEPIKHEVRVDHIENIDEQFHIQSRSWGSEYWEDVDSVSTDWSQE